MKHALLFFSAAALVACSPPQSATPPDATAPAAQIEPAPSVASAPSTQSFVEQAARNDMFEIDAGRLAIERTQNTAIRTFAQAMVDAHTASSAAMRTTLNGVTSAPALPTSLDADHQRRLQELRDADAQRFDELYLDQQTEVHENALNLFRNYGESGDVAELRSFAMTTAATIEQHLNQVRQIDRSGADE